MNIAILGYGVVGKGVYKIAKKNKINVSYILMRDIDELTLPNMTKDLNIILNDPNVNCVVECIGGDRPAYDYVKEAILKGKHVVSSNKKMLVNHFKELYRLANKNNVHLLFSSACGGGIPWLKNLAYIKENESILGFKGIMNGTSNYILDKIFSDGLAFNAALKKAQELGYAEQDPSDDIDGIDTANKTILSMIIAYRAGFDLKDVFIKGISNISEKEYQFALNNNYRLVLLGKGLKKGNKYILYVIPTFVNKNSQFFNIKNNYNCFSLYTDNLKNLSFVGQGAGSLPTAQNVINDILDLNNPYKYEFNGTEKPDYSLIKSNFYIRTKNKISTNLIKRKIGDNIYVTKKTNIIDLKKLINKNDFVGEIENA